MKKKMMRTISFIFALLTILGTLLLPISAESADVVLSELKTLKIDGVPFDEKDYPVVLGSQNISLITAVEKGFQTVSNSPNFGFYIYVYNPGCMEIREVSNSIIMGLDDQCLEDSYDVYSLQLVGKSADSRFLKLRIVSSTVNGPLENLYKNRTQVKTRVYDISALRLNVAGTVKTYKVDKVFSFSGTELGANLKARESGLDALDVKLYDTNWISPNAGLKVDGTTSASIYDHYEISSVYFKVPEEYFENYDALKSIRAVYDIIHLTPIILTKPNTFDQTTKDAISNAEFIWESDMDVMDLVWMKDGIYEIYSENVDWMKAFADSAYTTYGSISEERSSLAYYFESLPKKFKYEDGSAVAQAAISSVQLEAYFMEQRAKGIPDYKLYDEIRQNVVMDYNSSDYDGLNLWKMTTFSEQLEKESVIRKWFKTLFTEDSSKLYEQFNTTANCIEILNPADYISVTEDNYTSVANELFISPADFGAFKDVCNEAVSEGCRVVLLRFGFTDYSCQPVMDSWEVVTGVGPIVGLVVDKWAYLNLNVVHLVFEKDKKDVVVPVVSNTINVFGNVDAFGDGGINIDDIIPDRVKDKAAELIALLKKVLVIILIVLFLPVILWVIRLIRRRFSAKRKRNRKRE